MVEDLRLEEKRFLPGMTQEEARMTAPLTLAMIGDAVYELAVRTMLVQEADRPVNRLQKLASLYEKAGAQSRAVAVLEPLFTPEEAMIYKRGRNARPRTIAKNATVMEYKRATGLEAVYGYLYLSGQEDRLYALIAEGVKANDAEG